MLGALNPAERATFERHLPTCATCREAVANLAVLPGLLGRLDAATAAPAMTTPPTLLARTLAAATSRRQAERRRRVWYGIGGGLVAVALAVAVGLGVHAIEGGPASPASPLAQMKPVGDGEVRVTAEVGLVATEGGTRVDMTCRYAIGYEGKWMIRLVVYPRWGGVGDQVGTWTATAGQVLSLSGITYLPQADIDRVELQRADSTPLLTWTHT